MDAPIKSTDEWSASIDSIVDGALFVGRDFFSTASGIPLETRFDAFESRAECSQVRPRSEFRFDCPTKMGHETVNKCSRDA